MKDLGKFPAQPTQVGAEISPPASSQSHSSDGVLSESVGDAAHADLLYFTSEFEGRLYAGWYRFIPGAKIEVFARGQVKAEACGDDVFPQDLACELLKEIVRETRGLISDEDW